MDAIDTHDETARLTAAEEARRDARGIVFLAGMAMAGALAVVATLATAEAPASVGTPTAQVSTH
ncbi:MAG TPA: hypothetical protein VMZ00_13125 [Sporichthya sp.]|nr:hypothetical protein [Sporichthya sp.]